MRTRRDRVQNKCKLQTNTVSGDNGYGFTACSLYWNATDVKSLLTWSISYVIKQTKSEIE